MPDIAAAYRLRRRAQQGTSTRGWWQVGAGGLLLVQMNSGSWQIISLPDCAVTGQGGWLMRHKLMGACFATRREAHQTLLAFAQTETPPGYPSGVEDAD